jgi:hydrogenase maturation protease
LNARIIGIGQPWAGDDGAGLAVIRHLRGLARQLDLVEMEDASRLLELLIDGADPVVIVDAAMDDGTAGRIVAVDAQRHGWSPLHLLSTHGVGVMQAIELARIAYPDRVARQIFVLAITIAQASPDGGDLSEAVQAAVPRAAAQALQLCRTHER